MEDVVDFSEFSIEDDGSLLILSRNAQSEPTHSVIPFDKELLSSTVTDTSTISVIKHDIAQVENTFDSLFTGGTREDNLDRGANIQDDLDRTSSSSVDDMDASLLEIQDILRKEQENLQLIRSATEMMETLLSIAKTESTATLSSSSKTVDVGSTSRQVEVLDTACKQIPPENGVTRAVVKPCKKIFHKLSKRFHHFRQEGSKQRNTYNTILQNYYRSLNSSNRYIILASVLSFFTAYCLLSWHSAQTHFQDLELFRLKEKHLLVNHEALEKLQLHQESFRENLIHQRYEETRECQSSLNACHSKRDELIAQISLHDQHYEKGTTEFQVKLEIQRKEIEDLKVKQRMLLEENKTLRKELGQSLSSVYGQILATFLNICRNRTVQVLSGTMVIVTFCVNLICIVFRKY